MIDLRLAKDEIDMILSLLKKLDHDQIKSVDLDLLIRYLTNKAESEDDQEGFETKQAGYRVSRRVTKPHRS